MRADFVGLSYPERHQLLAREGATLVVYVPSENPFGIAPRSGIVGDQVDEGMVVVDYEGWVHGAYQYEHLDVRGKWEAAVKHAAGRAFVRYPTVARMSLPVAGLQPVGLIAAAGDTLTITDEAAVQRWLDA